MKTKKSIVLVALAALFALTLFGCSSDKQPEQSGEPAAPFSRGVWEESVYTNTFAGITYTLPEGWLSMSDEDMLALMGSDQTEITAEDKSVYDMMVQDPSTGDNIIIMMEDLAQTPGADKLSVDQYITLLKTQMEDGYTCGDTYEQELSGHTYTVLPVTISSDGFSMEQHHMMRREGDHLIDVLFTVSSDTGLDGMMAAFS